MKVLGGKFRGRNIYMPEDIRPTQNVVRKAVFDIIGHDWDGFSVLELFAGSGAVGIEALSRGAEHCTFVEKDPKSSEIITENLQRVGIATTEISLSSVDSGLYSIIQSDAFATIKQLSGQKKTFDIVFIDPPYGRDLAKKSLKTIGAYDILHSNSTLVLQHDKKEILPEDSGRFSIVKQKNYGGSVLSIYQIKD